MEGKKHRREDVPCSRETTQVCNITWPTQAFSNNQHAKSITSQDLRVTGPDSCVGLGQNRLREQQRAWVLLWELVHISMNSCSIRGYVNLDNKLSCEEWIYILDSCLFNICRNLTRIISDSHFVNLPSIEEAERVWNYNHTQAVFYAFFSLLLWIKMLPSFSHSVYSLIHLVGPTCLSLICLPCTIPHFSLPLWIIYLHTTPPPPSIVLAPFFSSRSLFHLSSSPLHIHHSLCPFSPSSHSDVSRINFPILLIRQIKFYPPPSSLLITILWKKEKKSTDLNRQINHQVIASSFGRSRLPADEWTRSLFSFL